MSIYRGPGGAGDATNDATVTEVQQLASEAAASASSAQTSANNASSSASSAATSATNSSNSASAASGSAGTAASSASAAATSATNAANSASSASTSASNASNSATAAANSATSASNSASAASTSATNAANSASAASDSADESAASAASALAIYGTTQDVQDALTEAETAATNAAGSASLANGYAIDAANSASDALSNANAAQGYSSTASSYASAASVSASNASNSATSAANSAASASAIYGGIEAVNTAVTNSQANRDAAAASATAASNSASAAATSATSSATSATNAATSAAAASAVALGNEPVRHSVRPSLLLDFANTKTLDPRITFTRASTGTFYDGRTVAKAEENLYTYSQDFDNADWTKVFVTTTTNSTTAPDGTATAETIVEDTANNVHRLNKAAPIIASTPYVFSIYVKDVNRQFITLSVTGASSNYFGATYDLTNVTVPSNRQVGTGYVYTSASITAVGNGWYRLVLIGTVGTAVSSIAQCIGLSTTGTPTVDGRGTESYTGTGASLYLWGAQLEQRSSVTAYTATTTAPITNYIPALQTAAANVARFEHNPVTGESLGLEIEEQRSNLLTYSSDFSNAAWSKVGTLTANDTIAPDGTLSAERLSTGTANLIGLPSFIPVTSGIAYTGSVWLKSAVLGQPATLRLNLSKGVATPEASLSITTTDQWVRYTVTLTTTSTGLFFQIGEWGTLGYGPTKDVHVWGAQLEAGSFATSYIPTVASQVTRSADSAVMTGTNFSSWYRGDAGTIYAETQASAITSGYQYAITSGNSTASGAGLFYDSASSRFSYRFWDAGGTAIGVISYTNAGSPNATTSYKTTFAFSTNDFAGSINGNVVTTDTSGVINGIADNLKIGASNNNTSLMNGTIKKLAYYPKRLTNAELVAMTTI